MAKREPSMETRTAKLKQLFDAAGIELASLNSDALAACIDIMGWDDNKKADYARVLNENEKTILRNARFHKSVIGNTRFRDIDMRGMTITNTTFMGVSSNSCDWRGTKLSFSQLAGVAFQECNLQGVEFDSCRIHEVIFKDCDLTGISIKNSQKDSRIQITNCFCNEEDVKQFEPLSLVGDVEFSYTSRLLKATRGDPIEIDRPAPGGGLGGALHCAHIAKQDLRGVTVSNKYSSLTLSACDLTDAIFYEAKIYSAAFREVVENRC